MEVLNRPVRVWARWGGAAVATAVLLLTACSGSSAENGSGGDDTSRTAESSKSTTTAAGAAAEPVRSTVFRGGEDDIDTFRIPGAVTTSKGSIVVVAEARIASPLDTDPHRLVSRRSDDGGANWGAIANVAPLDDPRPGCSPTDPTPVAPLTGPAAGDVLMVFRPCRDGGGLRIARSANDGRSWSKPTAIDLAPTNDVSAEVLDQIRTGPGHGIELTKGPHAGRLVVAGDRTLDGLTYSMLLLSDDGGSTWKVGATEVVDGKGPIPNESALTELGDGTILVSTRNASSTNPGRIQLRSSDGGSTYDGWPSGQKLTVASELTVPMVEGALVASADGDAVFASPSDPRYRRGLRLWTSHTGTNWQPGPLVVSGPAAYSDLVPLPGFGIGVVVETGKRNPYQQIDFIPVASTDLNKQGPPLPEKFDVAGAVAGRVVIDGTERFDVTSYCIGAPHVKLDGGEIAVDLTKGLGAVSVSAHLDDGGDAKPLDLSGTVAIDTEAGITFRGQLTDTAGATHKVDLVMVNVEPCP